jgi:hypothetical protein
MISKQRDGHPFGKLVGDKITKEQFQSKLKQIYESNFLSEEDHR